MRIKDELKQAAIIKATVKLVNEIGFVSASVAKIAKEANVSPASIYVYYKNKEDLLVSTYLDIKKQLSEAMLVDYDESRPVRDIFETMWLNTFRFISKNKALFQFAEQFSNSPYSGLVDPKEVDKYYKPMTHVLKRGIKQKIIKDVHHDMLTAFIFYPIAYLSNPRLCRKIKLTNKNVKSAFNLAWDAIKL